MAYVDDNYDTCDICGARFAMDPGTYEDSGIELYFEEGTVDVCRPCADMEDNQWTTGEGGEPARYIGSMEWVDLTFAEVKPFLRDGWESDTDIVATLLKS